MYRLRRAIPLRILAAGLGKGGSPGWRPLAAGLGVPTAGASSQTEAPHENGVWQSLGRQREFGSSDFWFRESDGLLFLFNLHEFSDLARYAAGSRTDAGDRLWQGVVDDWLTQCGTPQHPGWHPYPTSGRVIAWCAALSSTSLLGHMHDQVRDSLRIQLRWLSRCVEYDIGGNHVLRNATALVVGGECLCEPRLAAKGHALLRSELGRQVLADGGHEERSPCYHRLILDDLRDVGAIQQRADGHAATWLAETTSRMEDWLTAIAGPAGDVPPLNDGWDGPPLVLACRRTPLRELPASGYAVLEEDGTQAILDVGPLAPSHLPAHAHADALSLLLWGGGVPVLVDRGSYAYSGDARDAYRGTSAHNTLTVDGRDQCELWGDFRAAHMPTVTREELRGLTGGTLVRATHDGFRGTGPAVHERTFIWLGAAGVVVIDRLRTRRPHPTVSRLHFHEAVANPLETLPGGLRYMPLGAGAAPRVEESFRSPAMGVQVPIRVLIRTADLSGDAVSGFALTRPGVGVRLSDADVLVFQPGLPDISIRLAGKAPP